MTRCCSSSRSTPPASSRSRGRREPRRASDPRPVCGLHRRFTRVLGAAAILHAIAPQSIGATCMSQSSSPRPADPATSERAVNDGVSRRAILTRSMTGVGIALTGSYSGLFGMGAAAADPATAPGKPGPAGYGPLIDDPAGILSLPEGFTYTVVAKSGVTRLASGEPSPSDPDGAACFVRHGGNGSVLVLNHEISGSEPYPVPRIPGFVYDPAAKGGTTNVEVDNDGNLVRQYVSLA